MQRFWRPTLPRLETTTVRYRVPSRGSCENWLQPQSERPPWPIRGGSVQIEQSERKGGRRFRNRRWGVLVRRRFCLGHLGLDEIRMGRRDVVPSWKWSCWEGRYARGPWRRGLREPGCLELDSCGRYEAMVYNLQIRESNETMEIKL